MGLMYMEKIKGLRKHKEIEKYLEEAETRVSWARKQNLLNQIMNGEDIVPYHFNMSQDEWTKKRLEALNEGFTKLRAKKIIQEDDYLDGWDYYYWVGIMSALRWVTGAEKDFLDT